MFSSNLKYWKLRGFSLVRTFRGRVLLVFIFTAILPLVLIGAMSYISIQSITVNKIDRGFQTALRQVKLNLENSLYNLDYTSQQFANQGLFGQDLQKILISTDIYEKAKLEQKIMQNLNVLNFTNPNVGMMLYYFPDTKKTMFSNLTTREFDLKKLPVLAVLHDITYNGPHLSLYSYTENEVFSIIRKVYLTDADKTVEVNIYMETNFKFIQNILNSDQFGMKVSYILTDNNENIVYSENPKDFAIGSSYRNSSDNALKKSDYLFYKESSKQGWEIIVGVKKQDFEKEITQWKIKFALFAILSLAVSLFFAMTIWKYVYRNLKKLQTGINQVTNSNLKVILLKEGIEEFDNIIDCFNAMNKNLSELILVVETKEREKQEIELEKLLSQINPHFLYNTLNTVQWIARIKGQTEIDHLVSVFTRLLYYNIGKKSIIVTLQQEIEALRDYIEIQMIRYSFNFSVSIEVEEEAGGIAIPRFILQPLVENSIYHGLLNIKGEIVVRVWLEDKRFMYVSIKDNGKGMTQETIRMLFEDNKAVSNKYGLGIGLQYVSKMLKAHYGDKYEFRIESHEGLGTDITIKIPTKMEAH